jgi:hypothetical protein
MLPVLSFVLSLSRLLSYRVATPPGAHSKDILSRMSAKDPSSFSERSPLLARNGTDDSAPVDKPLPKVQLAIICYARMMEAW